MICDLSIKETGNNEVISFIWEKEDELEGLAKELWDQLLDLIQN